MTADVNIAACTARDLRRSTSIKITVSVRISLCLIWRASGCSGNCARRGTMTAVSSAFRLNLIGGVAAPCDVGARGARCAPGARRPAGTPDRRGRRGWCLLHLAETDPCRRSRWPRLDLRGAGERPEGRAGDRLLLDLRRRRTLLPAVIRAKGSFSGAAGGDSHELEPVDAIEAVRDGSCHLAVSFAYNLVPRPDVAGLVAHPLMDEPVLLALPAPWREECEPIALERLAQEDWIIGSRQPDDRRLAERACAAAGFAPRITHTSRRLRPDPAGWLRRGSGSASCPDLGLRFPRRRSCGGRHAGRRAAAPPCPCVDAQRARRLALRAGAAVGAGRNGLRGAGRNERAPPVAQGRALEAAGRS